MGGQGQHGVAPNKSDEQVTLWCGFPQIDTHQALLKSIQFFCSLNLEVQWWANLVGAVAGGREPTGLIAWCPAVGNRLLESHQFQAASNQTKTNTNSFIA